MEYYFECIEDCEKPVSEQEIPAEELSVYGGMTEPVDESSAIDALDDPLTEISEKFHSTGEVIKGHGLEDGTYIDFCGYKFPNILAPAAMCTGEVHGLTSYDAHQQFYTNPAVSSSLFKGSVEPFFGPTLTPRDAPEHTKYPRRYAARFYAEADREL